MDKIKGFRTIAFNAVMGIGMLLTITLGIDTSSEVAQVQANIDAILTGLVSLWLVGSILLRAITDSPIFTKVNRRW